MLVTPSFIITEVKEVQELKADLSIVVTLPGMVMEVREEQLLKA
ncbi:hypothetical protein Barb6XT_03073 [Bacteroidales bacterium Barb6XT]|nr:hypothetical protein Barb6XT_03073 [Bacteroidales bacterium Barb6XT]